MAMEISKESTREFLHGWQTVGVDAVQITPLQLTPYKGILLTCPGTAYDEVGNAKPVWVGGPRVTADNNAGTGGIPIVPGASMFIPIDKPDLLWVVSTQADQKIAWMVV
jgi:hypothetical protein